MYKLIHESAENPASAYYCETLEEALSLFSQIQAIIDANRFSAKGSAILIDLETGEVYISYERLFFSYIWNSTSFLFIS